MSLKAFHVFFVLAAMLLEAGCGLWLVRRYSQSGAAAELAGGVICLVAALGLVVYFAWIIRKLKRVSYI